VRRDPVPTVYSLEEERITCVGLAPAKSGVFMAAVRHVLVVCTAAEAVLLGACFSGNDIDRQARAATTCCIAGACVIYMKALETVAAASISCEHLVLSTVT
jgi:hypothetical protein